MRRYLPETTSKTGLIIFVLVIVLFIVVPAGCFAEAGSQNEQLLVPTLFDTSSPAPSDAPIPALYETLSSADPGNLMPTLYGGSGFISVKLWTSSQPISATPFREGWVSENQLVMSYATLVKAGNGLSYPGGMAAGMGGGDSMGGGGSGGGSGGGGGGCGG